MTGAGIDEQQHRPEDWRRPEPLVEIHPLSDLGQTLVDVSELGLGRTQEAAAHGRPDLEVVLVRDLQHTDRTVENELRLAAPKVEQASMEPGVGRRERVIQLDREGERGGRPLEGPIGSGSTG
jgi:hypothetical protein